MATVYSDSFGFSWATSTETWASANISYGTKEKATVKEWDDEENE